MEVALSLKWIQADIRTTNMGSPSTHKIGTPIHRMESIYCRNPNAFSSSLSGRYPLATRPFIYRHTLCRAWNI